MANPTRRAYLAWDKSDASGDFLQLTTSQKAGGSVLGWIDNDGHLQGSLAEGLGGTSTFTKLVTTVSTAQIGALQATPVQIIPPGTASQAIFLMGLTFQNKWTSGAHWTINASDFFILQPSGSGPQVNFRAAANIMDASTATLSTFANPWSLSASNYPPFIAGKGLYLTQTGLSGEWTGGTTTLYLTSFYTYIDLF